MQKPVWGVCLLAHNDGAYISTAIESVLAQTFTDWEMLICDDASGDETCNVVKAYLGDARIRYMRHPENLGQPRNWAYALKHTSAPFVATLHADDAWEPHALQTYAAVFERAPDLDFVWANWDYYDSTLLQYERTAPVCYARTFMGTEAVAWLAENNHALPSATAFRRCIVGRAGMPNMQFQMLCDREYFLRLSLVARQSQAAPVVVLRYRQNPRGISARFIANGRYYNELFVFAGHLPFLLRDHPEGGCLQRIIGAQIGCELLLGGIHAGLDGRWGEGRAWFRRAWALAGGALLRTSVGRAAARLLMRRVTRALLTGDERGCSGAA